MGKLLESEHAVDPEGKQQAAGEGLQGSLSRVQRVKLVIRHAPRASGKRTDHSSLKVILVVSLTRGGLAASLPREPSRSGTRWSKRFVRGAIPLLSQSSSAVKHLLYPF